MIERSRPPAVRRGLGQTLSRRSGGSERLCRPGPDRWVAQSMRSRRAARGPAARTHPQRQHERTTNPMSANIDQIASEQVRETVRERYADAARQVAATSGCGCGPGCCGTERSDPVTSRLYADDELAAVPTAAAQVSLGCGNPTA